MFKMLFSLILMETMIKIRLDFPQKVLQEARFPASIRFLLLNLFLLKI